MLSHVTSLRAIFDTFSTGPSLTIHQTTPDFGGSLRCAVFKDKKVQTAGATGAFDDSSGRRGKEHLLGFHPLLPEICALRLAITSAEAHTKKPSKHPGARRVKADQKPAESTYSISIEYRLKQSNTCFLGVMPLYAPRVWF